MGLFMPPGSAGAADAARAAYQGQVARNAQLIRAEAIKTLRRDAEALRAEAQAFRVKVEALYRKAQEMAALDEIADEIAKITSPLVERKPGHQKGSRNKNRKNKKAVASDEEFWEACHEVAREMGLGPLALYGLAEEAKSPEAKVTVIAKRLFEKGRRPQGGGNRYGGSLDAIKKRIANRKSELHRPTLLETAGQPPRPRGRPKKTPPNII
jgi:hypothetical protein